MAPVSFGPHASVMEKITVLQFAVRAEQFVFVAMAGTQPGEMFTVRGEGMPKLRRSGRRGDLRVVVNVVVPRRLNREQRKLAEKLADSMTPENVRTEESLVGKLKRLLGA